MKYRIQNSYYACFCGGAFWVDIGANSYGICPVLYTYVCDKCGKRKVIACEAEVKAMSDNETVKIIHDSPLAKDWRKMSTEKRREVVQSAQKAENEKDVKKIFTEIQTGQKTLF